MNYEKENRKREKGEKLFFLFLFSVIMLLE